MYAQQVELGHTVGPFLVFGGDFTLISIVATRVLLPQQFMRTVSQY